MRDGGNSGGDDPLGPARGLLIAVGLALVIWFLCSDVILLWMRR